MRSLGPIVVLMMARVNRYSIRFVWPNIERSEPGTFTPEHLAELRAKARSRAFSPRLASPYQVDDYIALISSLLSVQHVWRALRAEYGEGKYVAGFHLALLLCKEQRAPSSPAHSSHPRQCRPPSRSHPPLCSRATCTWRRSRPSSRAARLWAGCVCQRTRSSSMPSGPFLSTRDL